MFWLRWKTISPISICARQTSIMLSTLIFPLNYLEFDIIVRLRLWQHQKSNLTIYNASRINKLSIRHHLLSRQLKQERNLFLLGFLLKWNDRWIMYLKIIVDATFIIVSMLINRKFCFCWYLALSFSYWTLYFVLNGYMLHWTI